MLQTQQLLPNAETLLLTSTCRIKTVLSQWWLFIEMEVKCFIDKFIFSNGFLGYSTLPREEHEI